MKTNHFTSILLQKMLLLPFAFLFFSCSSSIYDPMKRKGLVPLHKEISGSYENTIITRNDREVKLSSIFALAKNDSVVEIKTVKNRLVVTFIDSLQAKRHKVFEGKFKKRYFQFHLEYDTVLVPPLMATIHENRVRLSQDENRLRNAQS